MNYLYWANANSATATALSAVYSGATQPGSRLQYDASTYSVTDTSNPGSFFKTTGDKALAITSGTRYWAAFGNTSTGDTYVGYDTASGYEGYFDNVATPPATWTDYSYGPLTSKRFSVYAEYTASGTPTPTPAKNYGFMF